MEQATRNPCANCERLQSQVDQLLQQVTALQNSVAQLQERPAAAGKNSSTSSKPPSSDIVKPKPPANSDGSKRPIGGQPGHPRHERALFPPEAVTPFLHALDCCPCCAGELRRNAHFAKVVQQVDFGPPPLTVEERTSPEYWCGRCQRGFYAAMPSHVEKGGLVGPRLTALIAYLKGACHASFSTARKFLRDVVGVTISRGQLAKVIAKVGCALDGPYQELLERLPGEGKLNVDETGHKDQGALMWTWCFKAEPYTLFKIDAHRSADVLIEVLGEEFDGVLGCDCFSAYRRYMRECDVVVQFCLAHLIRDVKFLTTLPGKAERAYGERLREALRELFGLIHRKEQMPARQFQRQLQEARERVPRVGTTQVPAGRQAQAMARRLAAHGASYFTFVTTPGVEPTNNAAEQAIRFVVIDRHITHGTRGEKGQRRSERIWTVMATCAQQGRSVWEYLNAAVGSYFQGEATPSLLPEGCEK
jgi:transposase